MAKLPKPDLSKIAATEPEFVERSETLWRIHRAVGEYRLPWNALREFGPLASARFDPWPPPPKHQDSGVGYFGFDWPTCVSEVFQSARLVDLTRPGYQISGFVPTRSLSLLNLREGYPIKVGASHTINGGPKNRCRQWAQAFRAAVPDLDGMIFTGMAGRDCVVLYSPARDAFGSAPAFSRALEDEATRSRVVYAAGLVGYDVLV